MSESAKFANFEEWVKNECNMAEKYLLKREKYIRANLHRVISSSQNGHDMDTMEVEILHASIKELLSGFETYMSKPRDAS